MKINDLRQINITYANNKHTILLYQNIYISRRNFKTLHLKRTIANFHLPLTPQKNQLIYNTILIQTTETNILYNPSRIIPVPEISESAALHRRRSAAEIHGGGLGRDAAPTDRFQQPRRELRRDGRRQATGCCCASLLYIPASSSISRALAFSPYNNTVITRPCFLSRLAARPGSIWG